MTWQFGWNPASDISLILSYQVMMEVGQETQKPV